MISVVGVRSNTAEASLCAGVILEMLAYRWPGLSFHTGSWHLKSLKCRCFSCALHVFGVSINER